MVAVLLVFGVLAEAAPSGAVQGPVGGGFVINAADLAFILKQIKIAERHARAFEGDPSAAAQPNPNPVADPQYCLAMVGKGEVDLIPDALTSYGLRTVDGSCNNLTKVLQTTNALNNHAVPTFTNHPTFGAADQPFPRLVNPVFRDAEGSPGGGFPPAASTSYAQKTAGNLVYDSQPRVISNLIVDQTSANPAAVAAAGHPVRSQNAPPSAVPCTTEPDPNANPPVVGVPTGCVPAHQTLFIPNISTDVGLSPPYNSLFTFFGQFFDHGVDQTVKGSGTVIVPLKDDDPLIAGPDHIRGNADDLPPSLRFMALSRAQNQPGPDGQLGTPDDVQDANNTDTPWVDNSQTYTSHASHLVFIREYDLVGGRPQATGRLLGGLGAGQTYNGSPDGRTGISTWASTKKQAAEKLGLELVDTDVTDVPMLLTDPYGNFVPGPARGLPQYVTRSGLVEGDLANPVPVPADVIHFDTPFLTDIAHNADPTALYDSNGDHRPDALPVPDADSTPSADFAHQPVGTYDDELLNAHFTCGDGRCNENIALSTIHQIFHSEHNRVLDDIKHVLEGDTSPTGVAALAEWQTASTFGGLTSDGWNGGRLFQAARFVNEMEYQHSVFEEFARKVQPAVRPFHVYSPDINPAVKAEFAHAVYRFGHSMLDDQVARTSIDRSDPINGPKKDNSLPLLTAFLNPPEFYNTHGTLTGSYTPEEAAGAIVMGSADQVGNEIDEFTTEVLRNNLLGLPLDLPTLNITRARSEGIPPLNGVRRQLHAATNDGQLTPYTSWADFGQHLKHPESLINFVAAYGTHPTITAATTIEAKRAAARAIVNPLPTDVRPPDADAFLFSTLYPGFAGTTASPGPDGVFGTNCGTLQGDQACADDIPAVPASPAADWTSNGAGVTTTGLDAVDLWVGGLAEVTNLFGGMLGSTFNYVFQTQLEELQDGDRLYYLARTPGMNLRTQLEGNSFSEMIQRNTDGTNSLKADAFGIADCKFQLAHLAGTPAGFAQFGSQVADDPTTPDCNENLLLLRRPDGTIQYRAVNSVNPSGINSQSVYNGTTGTDRVYGGNDNDTLWGGPGRDWIEGGGGDDVALGGEGDDVITDLDGADVPKGGPGNDAIDAGPGNDIVMGGSGNDFLNGGSNDNETFAGPGNDFIIAGLGADVVFGDSGDDWIEGGLGQDLLQGDHGAPFFDDPGQTAPGNEIFVGQPGENDYDAEGGDDLMAQNAAIDRNAGAAGFDWAFHQYNTVAADDDMMINQQLLGVPLQVVVNRDRWAEVEGNSGDRFNDIIRGTTDERIVGPGGFSGCDALDNPGVDRIAGLRKLVNIFPTLLADVVAASPMKACPLVGSGPDGAPGAGVWAEGNILLGGGGSDQLEGRGNNDIIDGDHTLHVAISVRANADGTGAELGRTDLMENKATSGSFGPGTTGMTLQQAVFAGLVNPGQLVAVREIVLQDGTPMGATPDTHAAADCGPIDAFTGLIDLSTTTNCDTAVFSGRPDEYTVTPNANGSVTVAFNNVIPFGKDDGIDTLWNVENLRFCTNFDRVNRVCLAAVDQPLAPQMTVAPTSLVFGGQVVGTTSSQSIIVASMSTNSVTVGAITLGGADASSFQIDPTSTCTPGGVLGQFELCFVDVSFTPTSVGVKSAVVLIASNASALPTVVTLDGFGSAPVANLSPTTLSFGNQTVGASSPVRNVTLTNTGTGPLDMSSISVSGPFEPDLTSPCFVLFPTLPAGLSCDLGLVFTPQATGPATGSVTVTGNMSGIARTTITATLTGTGVAVPVATVDRPSVAFGDQLVASTSGVQSVTVTNSGSSDLHLSGLTLGGTDPAAFAVAPTGTCTTTTVVPAGQSCRIDLTFRPAAAGARAATLTVASDAAPVTVALTGTGVVPLAALSPGSLAFGNQTTGTASTARTLTLANSGSAPLTISTISVTGTGFSAGGTCFTVFPTLAAGASCTVTVVFTPAAAGAATGTVTVTDNSGGVAQTSQSATLSGTGVGTPRATLAPTSVAFGSQTVGTTGAARTVTLTNPGNAPLTVTGLALGAGFTRTGGTCATTFPASVAAGGSCTVLVAFAPTAVAPASGTLTVTDNANGTAGSTQTVALTGRGVPAAPGTVADSFNRADAVNLGPSWQQAKTNAGLAVLRVSNNQATARLGDNPGSAFLATAGGSTQGVGVTITGTPDGVGLYLKASGALGANSGLLQNAVRVRYNNGNVTVATTTNGNANNPNWNQVGQSISTGGSLNNGNKLQAVVDSTGTVWIWKVVGSTTTLLTPNGVQLPNNALWTTGGGQVGILVPNNGRVDNVVR